MRNATRVLKFASVFTLCACADATRAVAPDDGATLNTAAAESTALLTGSAHFNFPNPDSEWRNFTISAFRNPDNTVSGEFNLVNRASESELSGTVFCAGRDPVAANAVYVAVRIGASNTATVDVGELGLVWVEDNGQGTKATGPDRATAVFTQSFGSFSEATANAWCQGALGNPYTVYEAQAGNLQVR